eukprot:4144183-Prymnesium_polylepis.1
MWQLIAAVARCCRAIDDVLLLGLNESERQWVLKGMYPDVLELKEVSATPGVVQYLDLAIDVDRGGLHTRHYDKRDELRAQGKMEAVMKYPHVESVLATSCKYNV